jgi:hypothetical protein
MTIPLERLRARILASINVDGDGCWIWQKTGGPNGYGTFALGGGNNIGAHRASYAAFNGCIPAGMDVCHKCDVRLCVNPNHLFLGTRAENIRDAAAKQRLSRTHQAKGADHPSAKLDDSAVLEILARLKHGEPKARIARSYGVSDRIVLLIARRELWKHVPRIEA